MRYRNYDKNNTLLLSIFYNSQTMKTLVTGDFILDTFIMKGNRMHSSSANEAGTWIKRLPGGANLTYELLKGAMDEETASILETDLNEKSFMKTLSDHPELVSYIEFEWNNDHKKWNHKNLGYGSNAGKDHDTSSILNHNYKEQDLIVIDDANLGFRNHDPEITNKKVILKMAYPFCSGKMWQNLKKGNNEIYSIVTLDNLRLYDVKVSKAISWEQTALDLCFELAHNYKLKELLNSTYLIILIGSAGALCIKPDGNRQNTSFELVFDPVFMEDEWEEINGKSIGAGSTFTAGFTKAFLKSWGSSELNYESKNVNDFPRLYDLVSAGLNHVRILYRTGFLSCDHPSEEPALPLKQLKNAGSNNPCYYSRAYVPSPYKHKDTKILKADIKGNNVYEISINYLRNSRWTILENNYYSCDTVNNIPPDPYYSLARNIAIYGPSMIQYAPIIRFGKFISFDRSEIESLRNIRLLVASYYRNNKADRPLNIAVFGSPGSGKSFAVKQLAASLIGDKESQFLEYNLSQFNNPSQLTGAFHSVRDSVLMGKLPFVFWDEFDSGNLSWLTELIAPMQDGKFLENGVLHPLGKCVFIFAGGTCSKLEAFNPEFYRFSTEELAKTGSADKRIKIEEKQELLEKEFRMKKGPDFLSRINGYLDVQGPNRKMLFDREKRSWIEDTNDVCFPVRRALFLRSSLGLKDGVELKIDWGLVSALIELSNYIRGSRSVERLLAQLKLENDDIIVRSNLPSDEIIGMNVDFADFMKKLYSDRSAEEFSEKRAMAIHNLWIEFSEIGSSFYNEYRKLNYDGRKYNISAARRLFGTIDNTGKYKIETRSGEFTDASDEFESYIKQPENLELLAEMGHNAWMNERIKDGWKALPDNQKERNDYLRIHPAIRPYSKLSKRDKEKARMNILNCVKLLKNSDFIIVRI